MGGVYESIMAGLTEAVEDAQGTEKKLKRHTISVVPVKEYDAEQVKQIRKSTGMSQKAFAGYMGVSDKTVEAWEAGTNRPSGAASRILNMMEMDEHLTEQFPFVITASKARRNAEYMEKLNKADEQVQNGQVITKSLDELFAMEE